MHINDITKLLGLEDGSVKILGHYEQSGVKYIEIVREKYPHPCPTCQTLTSHVHDYRIRRITHAAYTSNKAVLLYKRRRYRCPKCQKRFPEENLFVSKYEKISHYTKLSILNSYHKPLSFKSIADSLYISSSTVIRHGEKHINPKRLTLPEVLSIDEFKNLRKKNRKYACLLVNPINKEVIDVLYTRRIENLRAYFMRIPLEERKRVKYVTSDLWDPYRRIVKEALPNARLIADKFHFVRYIYWAFNDVRVRVMVDQKKGSVNYYLLKKHWKILNKYTFDLSIKHYYDYKLRSYITPREIVDMARDIHPDLKIAIDIKDDFYEALHTLNYQEAEDFLPDFIHRLKYCKVKEFKALVKTFNNWYNEILNAFPNVDSSTGEILHPSFTNATIEGFNNKIKVIKRNSYGFRNFWNFRRRIMTAFNQNQGLTFT